MDIKSRLNLCSPYIAAEEINFISPNENNSTACGWLKIYGCKNNAIFSNACSIVFESDLDTESHNIKTNNIGLACNWYIKKDSSTDHLLIGSECSTCSSLNQPSIKLIPGCIYLQITPEVEVDASFANDKMLVTKKYVDDNAGKLDYNNNGGFVKADGEAIIQLGHGSKTELTLQGCSDNGFINSQCDLQISSQVGLTLCSELSLCLESYTTTISGSCVKVYSEGLDSSTGGIYLTSSSNIDLNAEGDISFHSEETFNGCAQEVYIKSNDVVISSECREGSTGGDDSGSGCSDIGGSIVLDASTDIVLDADQNLNICSGCEMRMCSCGDMDIHSYQITRISGNNVDLHSDCTINLISNKYINLCSSIFNVDAIISFSRNPSVTTVCSALSDNSLVTKSYVDTAIAGVSGGSSSTSDNLSGCSLKINVDEQNYLCIMLCSSDNTLQFIPSYYLAGGPGGNVGMVSLDLNTSNNLNLSERSISFKHEVPKTFVYDLPAKSPSDGVVTWTYQFSYDKPNSIPGYSCSFVPSIPPVVTIWDITNSSEMKQVCAMISFEEGTDQNSYRYKSIKITFNSTSDIPSNKYRAYISNVILDTEAYSGDGLGGQ